MAEENRERDFYRKACRLAAEIVEADAANFFLPESTGALISIAQWDHRKPGLPGRRFEKGVGLAGAALISAGVEIHTPENPHPAFVDVGDREGIAMVACAIRHGATNPLAVLCVESGNTDASFSREAIERLDVFAVALAPVLRSVELIADLQESNRRLAESVDRTARLYSIAVKIADRRPLAEVLEEMGQAVRTLFGYEHFGFFVMEPGGARLEYAHDLPNSLEEGFFVALDGEKPPSGQLHACVRDSLRHRRENVVSIDAHGRPRGPISCAFVPFESGASLIGGVLLVRNWEEIHEISVMELERCRIFFAQCALALDQALTLEKTSEKIEKP